VQFSENQIETFKRDFQEGYNVLDEAFELWCSQNELVPPRLQQPPEHSNSTTEQQQFHTLPTPSKPVQCTTQQQSSSNSETEQSTTQLQQQQQEHSSSTQLNTATIHAQDKPVQLQTVFRQSTWTKPVQQPTKRNMKLQRAVMSVVKPRQLPSCAVASIDVGSSSDEDPDEDWTFTRQEDESGATSCNFSESETSESGSDKEQDFGSKLSKTNKKRQQKEPKEQPLVLEEGEIRETTFAITSNKVPHVSLTTMKHVSKLTKTLRVTGCFV
jgi:hypothetical protein